jgi:hypothetical protein
MKFRTLSSAALATLGLSFSLMGGCGGGGSELPPSPTPPPTGTFMTQPGWTVQNAIGVQATKKYTILNYINGANDLEEYMTLNVNQMEKIGSSADVNMVVQYKRISRATGGSDYDTSSGNWDDTRRYYITRDADEANITSTVIAQRPDCDMGDKQSLRDFIDWGVQTFPAEKYILIVGNHGAGWRSKKTRSMATFATRGFSYDDVTNNHIDTVQMPEAIDLSHLIPGRKWDVFVMDCSLMQMAEVAYQIRDKADWLVGSQESPPGSGYPYDKFLGDLVRNPNMAPKDFAIDVIDQTYATYGGSSNITQSVVDMSKVGAIVPALDSFGSALNNAKTTWGNDISDARALAESYAYSENKDLVDFTKRLSETPSGQTTPRVNDAQVLAAGANVKSKVQAAVVKFYAGTGGNANSNGLAIYLPTPTEYRQIDIDQANGFGQRFTELQLSQDAPNWQSFLANGPR